MATLMYLFYFQGKKLQSQKITRSSLLSLSEEREDPYVAYPLITPTF